MQEHLKNLKPSRFDDLIAMKRSVDHILTTHTGSLPKPLKLVDIMRSKDMDKRIDPFILDSLIRESINEITNKQSEITKFLKKPLD